MRGRPGASAWGERSRRGSHTRCSKIQLQDYSFASLNAAMGRRRYVSARSTVTELMTGMASSIIMLTHVSLPII